MWSNTKTTRHPNRDARLAPITLARYLFISIVHGLLYRAIAFGSPAPVTQSLCEYSLALADAVHKTLETVVNKLCCIRHSVSLLST